MPLPGSYRVCYKPYGQNYTEVGQMLLTVSTNSTPDSSYREIGQNVSFSAIKHCHHWKGNAKQLLTLGYATSIGIYDEKYYLQDQFLHTECHQESSATIVTFTITTLQPTVLRQRLTSVRSASISGNVTLLNKTAPVWSIPVIKAHNIVVFAPGLAHLVSHSVSPMVWIDDGSLGIGTNESITLLRGFGLKLQQGQDAAKAY